MNIFNVITLPISISHWSGYFKLTSQVLFWVCLILLIVDAIIIVEWLLNRKHINRNHDRINRHFLDNGHQVLSGGALRERTDGAEASPEAKPSQNTAW